MNAAPERILYVEDQPEIRVIGKLALERLGGFDVVECSCGEDALEKARTASADILLLDMMMPGMDGVQTLAALRAIPQTASTPAIFMTAKVHGAEAAAYLTAGAIGVIPKPFDPVSLGERIRELVRVAAATPRIEL